jgi:hypothetical protein
MLWYQKPDLRLELIDFVGGLEETITENGVSYSVWLAAFINRKAQVKGESLTPRCIEVETLFCIPGK